MAKAQVSLRARVEDVETRPDRLIPYIADQPFARQLAGGEVTRADVLRIALARGLDALEAEAKAYAYPHDPPTPGTAEADHFRSEEPFGGFPSEDGSGE
jgi:hypothetical protein